jgi:hypothetical protein
VQHVQQVRQVVIGVGRIDAVWTQSIYYGCLQL